MKSLFIAVLLAFSAPALAQYKCTVNGKATYSDVPCAANSRYVGALEDNVSPSARQDAELLRRQQAIERSQIDREQDAFLRQTQRALAQQAATEDAQARAKADRCADHKRSLARNERSQAFYRDLGMQQSVNNRQQEAKAINDNIFRECP